MKRTMPWSEQIDVISSDESSSPSSSSPSSSDDNNHNDNDVEMTANNDGRQHKITIDHHPFKDITSQGVLIRRAEMYQDYMRKLPIPAHHGSLIPFSSWVGLGNSIKKLYGQPLHYFTNVLLKQWDQMNFDSGDEEQRPLDIIIHPCKAEASVWLVEEIHRRTSSHHHLAKLWLTDPMHHTFVDSIVPQL